MSHPTIVLHTTARTDDSLDTMVLVRLYGSQVLVRRYTVRGTDNERHAIEQFARVFAQRNYRLAGWRVREQVLRHVTRRAFALGVAFPWYYKDRFGPRYRYSDESVLDLYDVLTEYGVFSDKLKTLDEAWTLIESKNVLQRESSQPVYDGLRSAVLTLRANVLMGRHPVEVFHAELDALRDTLNRTFHTDPTTAPDGSMVDALGIVVGDDYSDVQYGYRSFLTVTEGLMAIARP